MKNRISLSLLLIALILAGGCAKKDRPVLGTYPKDTNPAGGPLKFYVAFDGTTADPLMNAVDSIRATFPSDNPLTFVDGVKGKAIKGESKKFIKYVTPNDWAGLARSFTVAFWAKGDGQTKNNTGGNGPEHVFSLGSEKSHDKNDWVKTTFLMFEGDNTACALKFYVYEYAGPADKWFVWENANMIPGLRDNQWHHYAFSYNATTSNMNLFIDGVANPNVSSWGTHGNVNIDNSKITEFRIGRGPRDDGDSDGESGWLQSSWKGSLDQFRMYTIALSAAEVSALYTNKL
jgi:hypothetical protein